MWSSYVHRTTKESLANDSDPYIKGYFDIPEPGVADKHLPARKVPAPIRESDSPYTLSPTAPKPGCRSLNH